MKKEISESLRALGLERSDFRNHDVLEDEFKFLRRHYLKKCLATHPDKGGDPGEFRNVNESFEFLKDLIEKNLITTLAGSSGDDSSSSAAPQEYEFTSQHQGDEMPSYEYYQEAAQQDMPNYRVEYAKTGRGKCFAARKSKICGEVEETVLIEKDEVRIGSLDEQSGTYCRWCHLRCWRVPSRIWLGIPDPDKESDPQVFIQALLKLDGVSLVGFADLKQQDQLEIVKHVSDKNRWAKILKKKKVKTIPATAKGNTESAAAIDVTSSALVATNPNQIVQKKKKFDVPVPGQGGALPNSLQGQVIVMTGIFPEVGGGTGLSLGKDKVKAMCQSFGARVTSAVSGKTTLLLVGKEPGMSKVQKAQQKKIPTTDIHSLREVIVGQLVSLDKAKPATITDFSAGYRKSNGHNGLALQYDKAFLEDLKQKSASVVPNNNKRPLIAIEAGGPLSESSSSKPKAAKKRKTANTNTTQKKKKKTSFAAGKENSNPTTTNSSKNHTDIMTPYSKMTCVNLRSMLKDRGLKVSGKKAVLIARLQESDLSNQPSLQQQQQG